MHGMHQSEPEKLRRINLCSLFATCFALSRLVIQGAGIKVGDKNKAIAKRSFIIIRLVYNITTIDRVVKTN